MTGDNHQSFAVEHEGRWLVNPGSLMRTTTIQLKHKPSIYEWYAKDNSIKRVYLPIDKNVIDTSHIEEVKKRDKRTEAYIQKLKSNYKISFDFEDNLERHLTTNKNHKEGGRESKRESS